MHGASRRPTAAVLPLLLLIIRLASCGGPPVSSDAVWLLSFKREADEDNRLLYALNEPYDYCEWEGVKCAQGRVVRFVVQSMGLRGPFPPDTLTKLDQLRVLSLRNNSLFGPIPDLSPLTNLKSLFLDHNNFSGSFPPSLILLHRILTLSLSNNNLSGSIPLRLNVLDRLIALRLDSNNFSGTLPPLNQTALRLFNVSNNNLTGPIPVTPTLSKLNAASFSGNPGLCGEIVHRDCGSGSRFFGPATSSSTAPLSQSEQSQGILVVPASTKTKHHQKTGLVVVGIVVAVVLVSVFVVSVVSLVRRRQMAAGKAAVVEGDEVEEGVEEEREVKVRRMEEAHRSGKLVFCCGEMQQYTLEMLMRASAELLGRGSVGTTYKAVLDSRLIVTVKRLDGGKSGGSDGVVFERHMEAVGRLRHPNLVPLRAYFQAKGERLVIYDYQPNGSLFNLVHGSHFPFININYEFNCTI